MMAKGWLARDTTYVVGSIAGGLVMTLIGYAVVFANHDRVPRPMVEQLFVPFSLPVLNVLVWACALFVLSAIWRRLRRA